MRRGDKRGVGAIGTRHPPSPGVWYEDDTNIQVRHDEQTSIQNLRQAK